MSCERITTRTPNGKWEFSDDKNNYVGYAKAMNLLGNRLAELEDKLESGRLVELPCKVGDTVYELVGNSFVRECTAYNIEVKKNNYIVVTVEYPNGGHWRYNETDFGKMIFTTKEAAEARLKELQEGKK